MRPLTEEETRIFFTKLAKYIGKNIQYLIDRTDSTHVFRLHNQRIYYVNELLLVEAQNCANDKLVSLGTCFGKFTKTNKFHLHITCLQYLSQYIKYKIWIKPNGEMSYLYGNNVLKTHLGRISESTPQYAGVVFYSMSDIPLGFGVTAYSTVQCRTVDATAVIAFHQSDIGEYLRIEDSAEVGADESVPVSKKQKQYSNDIDNTDNVQDSSVNKQPVKSQQYNNKQKFNRNNNSNKRNGHDNKQQYNNKKHKTTAG